MFMKDGYRFVQGLIPTKIHKELVEASRRLGQSKSETIRNAIAAFLRNSSCKCEDAENGQ